MLIVEFKVAIELTVALASSSGRKSFSVNLKSKEDFPTLEFPIRSSLNACKGSFRVDMDVTE